MNIISEQINFRLMENGFKVLDKYILSLTEKENEFLSNEDIILLVFKAGTLRDQTCKVLQCTSLTEDEKEFAQYVKFYCEIYLTMFQEYV